MTEEEKSRKLNSLEKETLNEMIAEKLATIKELCKKIYPDYDKNDSNYDKNLQIRNEVMRRIKFEQIKRSSLNNFIRDAKNYLLNKRKQSIEVSKTRRDSRLLFNDDIKIVKEEKEEDLINNPALQPKQKEFVRYVLHTLKKDGQKGRTKDFHVKKMLVDLFSFDLKHSVKDKTVKINAMQLYNSNAESVVEKYTRENYLSSTLKKGHTSQDRTENKVSK